MIKSMTEQGPTLSEREVDECEREIRLRLPAEYRCFLLKYNGGRPSPPCFPIVGFPNNPIGGIQVFLGVGHAIESNNLVWNYETFNGRIPANLLPVACTDSGHLICLSLFGDDAGSVVFWDFYDERPDPSYENVYHIADSFTEFIESIHQAPELEAG